MGTVLDLLLLAVIIYFIVTGMKRGFVRTLLSFVSRIASVLLAYFVSDEYDEIIYEKFFKESVVSGIEEYVSSSPAGGVSEQISGVLQSVPESVLRIIETLGIDLAEFTENASVSDFSGNMSLFLEQTLAGPVSVFVCRIIIFAVVSATTSFLFSVLVNLICRVVNLPVLRTANRALGGVLGLLNGVICIFIVSYILVIASGLIDNSEFVEIISSSHVIEIFTSTKNGFIGV